MKIRPAREDDLPLVLALHASASDAPAASAGLDAPDSARRLLMAGRLWVAVDASDRPAGVALLSWERGTPRLLHVAVAPSADAGRTEASLWSAAAAWHALVDPDRAAGPTWTALAA